LTPLRDGVLLAACVTVAHAWRYVPFHPATSRIEEISRITTALTAVIFIGLTYANT
jgi:hypothetical protein